MGLWWYPGGLLHLHTDREAVAPYDTRRLLEHGQILLWTPDPQHCDGCNDFIHAHAHCLEPTHFPRPEGWPVGYLRRRILVSRPFSGKSKIKPNKI